MCRTRLARSNFQARTGKQGKTIFPRSADHEQAWRPYPVDAQPAESATASADVADQTSYAMLAFLRTVSL